ncbi:MAG: colanic acid biosynthesis glycosyltransferase WcaL [Planctomycetota bacterium]|nr:MAG: colanic acid biosynthesis glycosyltransferase WcaL [Planctomycetota bacterium]
MNIAIVVGRFPAISETFILNQITGLLDRGHRVDILAHEPGETDRMHPEVESYRLLARTHYRPRLPRDPLTRLAKGFFLMMREGTRRPLAVARSLNVVRFGWEALSLQLLYGISACRDLPPYDVIHCHFANNALLIAHLRRIGAIRGRMLTTFHGHDVNRFPRRRGPDVYRPLFETCELYTANTDFTADRAAELGCPRERIVKLPVGVRLDRYTFRPRRREADEPTRILSVGRLVEKKGFEYAIRAVARVVERGHRIRYDIVGDGELRPPLEQLIADLHMQETIRLLGWKDQDELRSLYDRAHLFVLPSVTARDGDREGQGLVLQEAQAMGLPVVSTLHNGIPEGVLDGRSAFLVPERDVVALAERIEHLVAHPEVWEPMGRAGRALVEERFDIDKLNDRLVTVYERLIRGE